MFGPNTHTTSELSIEYSHRDKEFFSLYEETQRLFKSKFGLDNYEIVFIPGSGTVGIEALISSFKYKLVPIGAQGKFLNRWDELIKKYKSKSIDSLSREEYLYVRLETSLSRVNLCEDAGIVDAISSFPFYTLENPKTFVTCSNKLLGGFPGLSIVGIRKDCLDLIKEDKSFSYLNLHMYLEYSKSNQFPMTAPIHLLENLKQVLINFNLKELKNKVYINSDLIRKSLPSSKIIGDHICPVITIKKDTIPIGIAEKYQLYGLNSKGDYYQIFTYSDSNINYKNFIVDVKQTKQFNS
jgi:aspartate aminotransferase-like enzyme